MSAICVMCGGLASGSGPGREPLCEVHLRRYKDVSTNDEELQHWLDDVFTYHAPEPDDVRAYQAIREDAKQLARTIMLNVPSCADRTAAIRKLREAVMTANAARALKGRV